jgi:prephenate dehydratase
MARRLAFLGPAGTHTEQACIAYDRQATLMPYAAIPLVAVAVDSGEADEGVVPIENSVGGSVSATLDLLIHQSSPLIRHELVLAIKHFLVARRGTAEPDIKAIYSHPQALEQCRAYLSGHFPDATEVASMSTAAAVEEMLLRDGQAAAIATERAAALYDAEIVAAGIEDYQNNMTRFVVLAPSDHPRTGDDKTSICFSFDEDAAGILHSVLGEFAARDINLEKIESRPTREALGRYMFLVDLEGHREDALVRQALDRVREQVSTLRVFGSYPRHHD